MSTHLAFAGFPSTTLDRDNLVQPPPEGRISPDWSREHCEPAEYAPARQLLRAIRDYQRARASAGPSAWFEQKVAVLRWRTWSAVTNADIPLNSQLGGGLLLPHPNGVVIHPHALVGPNCEIAQQVTLGTGPRAGVPRIGAHVRIGPGAKVLGGVQIGDYALIGANSVVLEDVPERALVSGVPAKVVGRA